MLSFQPCCGTQHCGSRVIFPMITRNSLIRQASKPRFRSSTQGMGPSTSRLLAALEESYHMRLSIIKSITIYLYI